jgi:hypothetical protein
LSTNPITFAQDESETNTEQSIAQKNVGSGESTNNNCALNSIDATGTGQGGAEVNCPIDGLRVVVPLPPIGTE